MRTVVLIVIFGAAIMISTAHAERIAIVAAENFYGDVAQQIGGPEVTVTSILSSPEQDPHLFEVSPSVGRQVSTARIVIYNGIDYDPWMEKLLRAARSANRTTIIVAALVDRKTGDNPHVWFDPATMLTLAKTLCKTLGAADPAHGDQYARRLAQFENSLRPVQSKMAGLRERLAGAEVAATEPVFGYLFEALGLRVRNQSFQLAVMSNTEPSISDSAAFEDDLKNRRIKLLLYNTQATSPIADRMLNLAKRARVPIVGTTETEPAGPLGVSAGIGVTESTRESGNNET